MNNKGFAVTTILYGIMVLFCLLLVSLLSILSTYRKTQDKLINENNGARSIIAGNAENTSGGGSSSGSGGETTTYKITFVCTPGTFDGIEQTIDVADGEKVYLLGYNCILDGYLFSGWSLSTNGSNPMWMVTINGSDVTLYGVFNKFNAPPSSSDSTM